MLGEKVHNETGHVVAAKSVRVIWVTTWDANKRATESENKLIGLEYDFADPFTMRWEAKLIDSLGEMADRLEAEGNPGGYGLYYSVARRYICSTCNILLWRMLALL